MLKKHNKKFLYIAHLLIFMWSVSAYADDITDAKNAYGAGRFEEAANLLRPLVLQEVVEAVYLQARLYEKGDGVSKDTKEARRLYSLAAAKGHEAAQQKLDMFNVQSSDKSVVIDWYLPAAQEGDTEAQYNLGFMYETGWGVAENTSEAIRWYNEASEMQHDVAQLRLAMMTIVGVGIKASMRNGLELLHQSAENGNRIAEMLVQDMFDVGDVTDENARQVVSGIRRIFDDGEIETINTLRKSLETLRKGSSEDSNAKLSPVPGKQARPNNVVDVVKSITSTTRFRKPVVPVINDAEVESKIEALLAPKSNSNQNKFTESTRSIPKDKPLRWYVEQASNGVVDAQYELAILYITGELVEKDLEEGLHWMKQAAEQGHEFATMYIQLWEDDFSNTLIEPTIGVAWLKESARKWNQQSIFTLGTLYETGRGVEKNFVTATQWYQFAAANGHADAKRRLALIKKGGAILEGEGVSLTGENVAPSEKSLIILAIVIATMCIAVFLYMKYLKPRRVLTIPGEHQERVVMEKAKNSQGLQTDDRKFFDDLWASSNEQKKAEPEKVERKPAVIEKPAAEKAPEVKPKPAVTPEPVPVVAEEKTPQARAEGLSLIEKKLAKAVEDLVSGKDGEDDSKPANTKSSKVHDNTKQPLQAQSASTSLEKAMGKDKSGLAVDENQNEPALGADSFINNSISIDELASSRTSADRLFADGVAIDEAGRAVGQGSYNPHKLNADEVVLDEASSISITSVTGAWDTDAMKPRPIGAAASLLPKQSSITKTEIEPVSLNISSTAIEEKEEVKDEERSLAEVHYNIGLMFNNGDGVPKNETQAAKWFLKAAEEGLPEGQFSLGQAYLNGSGVIVNTELALDWIQKAANNDYKPAQDMLKSQNKAI